MRINQYLARCGFGSRRKVESFILSGLVSVNGRVITDLGANINPVIDTVLFDDKLAKLPTPQYIMLNKPKGYTVTKDDPHAKSTVFDLLPKDDSLITVGRLDRDTTGLIIITNDGHFAQRLIHPSNKIEKEYYLRTSQQISDSQIKTLLQGLELEDGPAKAKSIVRISENELYLTIEEGRNRIIRRMIQATGNQVTDLRRDRIGELKLDVLEGQYRPLRPQEIKLYA